MRKNSQAARLKELEREFNALWDQLNSEGVVCDELPSAMIRIGGAEHKVLAMFAKSRGWTMKHACHVLLTLGVKYICVTGYDQFSREWLGELLDAELEDFPRPDHGDTPRRL
jgi:hypothetical protein